MQCAINSKQIHSSIIKQGWSIYRTALHFFSVFHISYLLLLTGIYSVFITITIIREFVLMHKNTYIYIRIYIYQ